MSGFSLALLRECSARLRETTHQLHAFAMLDAAGRIANALLRLGARFGIQEPHGLHLDIGLSQPELADLKGLTRTNVYVMLSGFKKSGWLDLEPDGALGLRELASLKTTINKSDHLSI